MVYGQTRSMDRRSVPNRCSLWTDQGTPISLREFHYLVSCHLGLTIGECLAKHLRVTLNTPVAINLGHNLPVYHPFSVVLHDLLNLLFCFSALPHQSIWSALSLMLHHHLHFFIHLASAFVDAALSPPTFYPFLPALSLTLRLHLTPFIFGWRIHCHATHSFRPVGHFLHHPFIFGWRIHCRTAHSFWPSYLLCCPFIFDRLIHRHTAHSFRPVHLVCCPFIFGRCIHCHTSHSSQLVHLLCRPFIFGWCIHCCTTH